MLAHITAVLSVKGMSTSPKVTLPGKLGNGVTGHVSLCVNFVACSVTVAAVRTSEKNIKIFASNSNSNK